LLTETTLLGSRKNDRIDVRRDNGLQLVGVSNVNGTAERLSDNCR
jgi:hypothetical protein